MEIAEIRDFIKRRFSENSQNWLKLNNENDEGESVKFLIGLMSQEIHDDLKKLSNLDSLDLKKVFIEEKIKALGKEVQNVKADTENEIKSYIHKKNYDFHIVQAESLLEFAKATRNTIIEFWEGYLKTSLNIANEENDKNNSSIENEIEHKKKNSGANSKPIANTLRTIWYYYYLDIMNYPNPLNTEKTKTDGINKIARDHNLSEGNTKTNYYRVVRSDYRRAVKSIRHLKAVIKMLGEFPKAKSLAEDDLRIANSKK